MSWATIPRTSHEMWMADLRDSAHERMLSRFPNDLATDAETIKLGPRHPADEEDFQTEVTS